MAQKTTPAKDIYNEPSPYSPNLRRSRIGAFGGQVDIPSGEEVHQGLREEHPRDSDRNVTIPGRHQRTRAEIEVDLRNATTLREIEAALEDLRSCPEVVTAVAADREAERQRSLKERTAMNLVVERAGISVSEECGVPLGKAGRRL
jgi:hypothetical protein